MNYRTIINNLTYESKEVLKNAIKIHKSLEKNKIKCCSDDLYSVSIIMSFLISDCDCNNILRDHSIDFEDIIYSLGINDLDIEISEEEIETHFNEEFIVYFNRFIKGKELSSLFPEDIVKDISFDIKNCLLLKDFYRNKWVSVFCDNEFLSEVDDSLFKKKPHSSNKAKEENEETEYDEVFSAMFRPKRKKTSIDEYAELLTERNFRVNPAVAREVEINHTLDALCTYRKHPLLTGEYGVGKTAIVEGIAYRIQKGMLKSNRLRDAKIYKVDVKDLVKGTCYRGDFEKRVDEILNYAKNDRNIILFFDEIHTALESGTAKGAPLDFANILKSYLDRESIKVIASTTNDEYDEYVKKDGAFKRRFERIKIEEPIDSAVITILDNLIKELESYNNVKFNYNDSVKKKILSFIVSACKKPNRVYNDMVYNPDLAISILCKAFAIAERDEKSNEVTLEHIKNAILMCDRLYDSSKAREINSLEKSIELAMKPNKSNIILFPSKQ